MQVDTTSLLVLNYVLCSAGLYANNQTTNILKKCSGALDFAILCMYLVMQ